MNTEENNTDKPSVETCLVATTAVAVLANVILLKRYIKLRKQADRVERELTRRLVETYQARAIAAEPFQPMHFVSNN